MIGLSALLDRVFRENLPDPLERLLRCGLRRHSLSDDVGVGEAPDLLRTLGRRVDDMRAFRKESRKHSTSLPRQGVFVGTGWPNLLLRDKLPSATNMGARAWLPLAAAHTP